MKPVFWTGEGHNRNRCTCKDCKQFRHNRASKAVKTAWSNDPVKMGKAGQDGLLAKFAAEVQHAAQQQGLVLTRAEIRKRAIEMRDGHLRIIAFPRGNFDDEF